MKSPHLRLHLAIALLAWLAQAFMPIAHAAAMADSKTDSTHMWCGEPASAKAALALLPADLRMALDEDAADNGSHAANCVLLCAVGAATSIPVEIGPVAALRAAGLEPALAPLSRPVTRSQAPTPPAHAPPARA